MRTSLPKLAAACSARSTAAAATSNSEAFAPLLISFYDMPVTVARSKLHVGVSLCGIFGEQWIHETHALKKLLPVESRQQPHAGNDVSDRYLRGSLPLVFAMNYLLDVLALSLKRCSSHSITGITAGSCSRSL